MTRITSPAAGTVYEIVTYSKLRLLFAPLASYRALLPFPAVSNHDATLPITTTPHTAPFGVEENTRLRL
jgi:hypothetical protein